MMSGRSMWESSLRRLLVLRESEELCFSGHGLLQSSIRHSFSKRGYGPPPAYPNLKIPGLNAPIPQAGFRRLLCRRACPFFHAGRRVWISPRWLGEAARRRASARACNSQTAMTWQLLMFLAGLGTRCTATGRTRPNQNLFGPASGPKPRSRDWQWKLPALLVGTSTLRPRGPDIK